VLHAVGEGVADKSNVVAGVNLEFVGPDGLVGGPGRQEDKEAGQEKGQRKEQGAAVDMRGSAEGHGVSASGWVQQFNVGTLQAGPKAVAVPLAGAVSIILTRRSRKSIGKPGKLATG
jgi:hypothetical protein